MELGICVPSSSTCMYVYTMDDKMNGKINDNSS